MHSVDLQTAILEQKQRAYMVHPGKGYHLFSPFLGHGVISSDLPELIVPDGTSPRDSGNIDSQVNRARALRDWLDLNEAERRTTEYSVALGDYVEQEKRRYHDSYIDNTALILWDLPEGTVVFVPNSDLSGHGFFCELGAPDEPRKVFLGAGKAKAFKYLGRPVYNIKRVPMRLVPPEILEAKSRQSVVTELDGGLSERVYRLFYGSFSMKEGVTQVEVDIPGAIFRPADAAILSGVANLVEDNLQKLERGERTATEFVEALFLAFDESELMLHARLNSPGVVQIAARSVTPMLLSVLLALSGEVSAQEIADEARMRAQGETRGALSINVKNTKCPEDEEFPRLIEDRLFGILDMMGEEEIIRVCDRLGEVKERTQANTDAVVE